MILYAGSGFIIALGDWVPKGVGIETSEIALSAESIARVRLALAAPAGAGQRERLTAAGKAVIRELDIPERFNSARTRGDGSFEASASRPGHSVRVRLDASERQAFVTRETSNPLRTLRNFHQLHGYRGGGLFFSWAFMLDVVSVAAILFALSGVVLWYLERRDRLGWVLLLTGTVYTSLSIALFWLLI